MRVAFLETYPGKEGGRRPTGPTDSHTGEPRAGDWSAPWYMRSQQRSLPLLPVARAGNGLAIQTRALWGAEDPGGADLGRGKEYSPHSSSKPAPQREGLTGPKDLGYWAGAQGKPSGRAGFLCHLSRNFCKGGSFLRVERKPWGLPQAPQRLDRRRWEPRDWPVPDAGRGQGDALSPGPAGLTGPSRAGLAATHSSCCPDNHCLHAVLEELRRGC